MSDIPANLLYSEEHEYVMETDEELRLSFATIRRPARAVGWLPYLMERLDEKFEKLPQQAPLLSQEPSHYVRTCPIYFSCELEEKILPYAISLGLEKKILNPSDYPHEPPTLEVFLEDVPRFRARKIFPNKANSRFCVTTASIFTH